MLDYYDILNIKNNSDNVEIANAYQKLAIKYHPSNNPSQDNYFKFCQICEAYEVLSNNKLREIYNKFGEEKMKEGILNENKEILGGYYFKGNPEEIFESFFGTYNLETVVLENGLEFKTFLNENRNRNLEIKDIKKEIVINLKEAYNGCTKKLEYNFLETLENGINVKNSSNSIIVNIRKEIDNNEIITFKEKGNQYPGYKKSDLIVIIKIVDYKNYSLLGNDIYYLKEISLIDSLEAKSFKIFSLDDKEILINVKEVIDPKKNLILKRKGFKNGDLIIKFNLIMPDLTEEQKNKIINVLNE